MTMSAAITVNGNPIVNQPFTCTMVISNSSGSAVNVQTIQPKVVPTAGGPTNGSVQVSPIFVPVGTAVASTTGFQNSIQVAGSGTATVSFQVLILGPVVQTGRPAQGGPAYLVSADCFSDDASVFSPPAIPIAVATPQFGQPQPAPNSSATAFGGELQFNQGANSALAL